MNILLGNCTYYNFYVHGYPMTVAIAQLIFNLSSGPIPRSLLRSLLFDFDTPLLAVGVVYLYVSKRVKNERKMRQCPAAVDAAG